MEGEGWVSVDIAKPVTHYLITTSDIILQSIMKEINIVMIAHLRH